MANPWWRAFVSLLASLVVLIPLAISEIDDAHLRWFLIGVLFLIVFLVDFYVVFRPDARFLQAREPALNFLFAYKFYKAQRKLLANERLPFRVNIMKPCRTWFLRRRMRIVYSYGMVRADPDYRITLPAGCGLCWDVLTTGQIGWFDRAVHRDEFGLTPEQQAATSHVLAVLSIPLRTKDREKPHAVLSFDALTQAAVDDLRIGKEELKSYRDKELLDIATLAGLFA